MLTVDLNCDMGESFGGWTMGADADLMNLVSSINIACGFHAGDPTVMRQTIQTAIEKGVAIGAHPGLPDLQGFGRREMNLSHQEVFDVVLYQVSAARGICEALGTRLNHVKPHGALYNSAAKNPDIARAIARAVKAIDRNLIFYGLSNSFLISEAQDIGLQTASEVFADRTYQPDGTLTPRNLPGALINQTNRAITQVLEILVEHKVTTTSGEKVFIKAETICIHGDGDNALEFARAIKEKLNENSVEINSISYKKI